MDNIPHTWFEFWYNCRLTIFSKRRHGNDRLTKTIITQCRTTQEVDLSSNTCKATPGIMATDSSQHKLHSKVYQICKWFSCTITTPLNTGKNVYYVSQQDLCTGQATRRLGQTGPGRVKKIEVAKRARSGRAKSTTGWAGHKYFSL